MLIKRLFFVLFLIFVLSFNAYALQKSDISASSAVVINKDTKEIVFEKNAYEKRSMASTTKIMTALLACESGRLNEIITISRDMCGAEGTSIGLKEDYKIRFIDLVYGMLLESGNDAANAVAVYLSGNSEAFAKLMNEKAYEIGMLCTNFVTPSGLDHEQHYTTAYDMALLGSYAVDNPEFKNICSQKKMRVEFISPDIEVTFSNHNRLLNSYEGTYGIKTGFTKKSGRCLVSAAKRDGKDFIAVTLSAGDDWNDHKKMLDYAFSVTSNDDINIEIPSAVSVYGGVFDKIHISAKTPVVTLGFKEKSEVEQKTYIYPHLFAPVRKSDVLGYVELISDGKVLRRIDIIATENCDSVLPTYREKRSLFRYIKDILNDMKG